MAIIGERATGSLAHELLAPGVVLTALVKRLGGEEMIVGAAQSLMVVAGISQLVTAWYMERPISRRRYVLRLAWIPIALLLVLALALWAWADKHPGLMLGLLLLIVFVRWSVGAMCNPALLDLARTLIESEQRAHVFAMRQFASALCGLAAGALTYVVLREFAFPAKYVAVVLLAAAASMMAWTSVLLIREREPRAAPEGSGSSREFFARLVHLLRPGAGGEHERHFRRYVAVRHAVFVSRCAYPFLTYYGLKRFEVHETTVGWFLIALWAGRLSSGLLLSLVRRLRQTPHQILRIALSCTLVGLLCAAVTPRWEGLLASFVLQGVFFEAFLVADPIFMMEHAPPGHEVLGMSLTMVALYPMNTVLPLIGGGLFATVGFRALAGLAIAGGLVAFAAVGQLTSRVDIEPELAEPERGLQ